MKEILSELLNVVSVMTPFLLAFLGCCLVIILAAYAQESSPWRYCPRCGYWRNVKTKRTYNYCPENCDGIPKTRLCEECEK